MRLVPTLLLLAVSLCLQTNPLGAQTNGSLDFLNHNRPVLDAHNCYPYEGKWADRVDRALKTGFPVGIEQDMAWYVDPATGKGRAVVSHDDKTKGSEPTVRDYFFERVRPIMEKALAENDRAHWPLIVLHFDFKSVEAPLLHAVWELLGEYQAWITTAVKTADPRQLSPFDTKPLLVLTEDSDQQEEVFFKQAPVGSRLRVFGSAHTKAIPSKPTAAHDRRLRALVDHAHRMGYWIRFYTLDGFGAGEDKGWGNGYNFGSREAVLARWKAAIAAGVNLIASDQYEDLAAVMR